MIESLLAISLIGWAATYFRMRLKIKFLEALVDCQSSLLDYCQLIFNFIAGKQTYTDNVVPFERKK